MKKEVGMGGSDENSCGLVKQSNHQGGSRGGGGKLMPTNDAQRRALSDIDENIVGPQHTNHSSGEKHLSEKRGSSGKRPRIPVHRPITRKLAAEIANKQQIPSTSTSCGSDDDIGSSDYPVPASVRHTEAMMDEIDNEMVEVEMEDMAIEMIANIDSGDKGNPLAVVDYIDDMYAFFKELEGCVAVPPYYMANQVDINQKMRGILIDWLIEVHYKFELMDETLFLTVNLIDRFLAAQQVERKKLQLVGITAMLIACKYEEVSVPVVDDLILISDKAYSRDEVLGMERLMVNILEFNLSVPTPYVFMRRFLKAAQSDERLELLSFFIVELCLVEYEMVRFRPSLLAAAAIFTAQCAMNGYRRWNRTIEWHSGYPEQHLVECSRLMVGFHQKAGSGKLTGVYRKYSTSRFGHAARLEPAHFLLE